METVSGLSYCPLSLPSCGASVYCLELEISSTLPGLPDCVLSPDADMCPFNLST